jgi:hypothetical protein
MPTYTVHEPPLRKGETAPNPERFVFVRDGFHFWAFLLGPIWMLARRMWLVLALYLVTTAVIVVVFRVVHAPNGVRSAVLLLIALLVGFEAATLRRFTLRKWKTVGVVVGENEEAAERRFFSSWTQRTPAAPLPPSSPPSSAPIMRGPPTASHVVGLFPEPGGSR